MKKSGVFLLVFLFVFISLASAESSDNEMQIRILGCSDGTNFASPGDCLGSTAYCAGQNVVQDVFTVPNACSKNMAPVDVTGTVKPYSVCCPTKTHECVSNGSSTSGLGGAPEDAFFCIPATKDCSSYVSFSECVEDHYGQCFWNGTVCVPRSNSCYDYQSQSDCSADIMNVSRADPNCRYGETESSGIPYIISQESCKCFWDPNAGSSGECGLQYNITPSFGDGSSYSICQYVFGVDSACTDGFETYAYTANYSNGTYGASNPLLQGDARCLDRTGRRRCGQPVVQVPFFSFLNVIFILFFLSIFYLIKIKFFGEKK